MTELTIVPFGRLAWIDVVLLVWFGLTAFSVAYVAWDAYRNNPELTVMKWGWVLVTLYLGPVSLFLYVLSCKSPTPEPTSDSSSRSGNKGSGRRSIAWLATPPGSSWRLLSLEPSVCRCRSI